VSLRGLRNQAANRAEVLKGKVRETAGKITGNPRLEIEGRRDQGKGNLKQAGEKTKTPPRTSSAHSGGRQGRSRYMRIGIGYL
jgi:uncharacterized protein YjbJ (UPF0337 family)